MLAFVHGFPLVTGLQPERPDEICMWTWIYVNLKTRLFTCMSSRWGKDLHRLVDEHKYLCESVRLSIICVCVSL